VHDRHRIFGVQDAVRTTRYATKYAVRAILQRVLPVVADRSNYFLVRGIYHPDSRFDHRAFLRGSDWGKSRDMVIHATLELLRREIAEWGVDGAVAEVGVSMGRVAVTLNRHLPEHTIYLFDTFAGFDTGDLAVEAVRGRSGVPYAAREVTVAQVRSRLPHPEKAEFRVGWFPESAIGCEGETFCLVNVDVGLYQPTYAALRWFYPRLADGGYLLVNDYNNAHCKGVREAVHQFVQETGAAYTVLPDYGAHAVIAKPRPAALHSAAKNDSASADS
jgi:O-methyltransferase